MSKLQRVGKNISTTVFGAAITFAPALVLAATPDTEGINGDSLTVPFKSSVNYFFSDIVKQVITIILFITGAAAIIYLLISGVQYVTAGGDDEKAATARKGIINAIIGIIIVAAAWLIFSATIHAATGVTSNSVGGGDL